MQPTRSSLVAAILLTSAGLGPGVIAQETDSVYEYPNRSAAIGSVLQSMSAQSPTAMPKASATTITVTGATPKPAVAKTTTIKPKPSKAKATTKAKAKAKTTKKASKTAKKVVKKVVKKKH